MSLQHAFPRHYLTALAAPPDIMDAAPFQMMRPLPSTLCLTLAHLRGVAGNTYSGSYDNANDDVALPLTTRASATVANPPPLTRPAAATSLKEQG